MNPSYFRINLPKEQAMRLMSRGWMLFNCSNGQNTCANCDKEIDEIFEVMKILDKQFKVVYNDDSEFKLSEIPIDVKINGECVKVGWDNWFGIFITANNESANKVIDEIYEYLNQESLSEIKNEHKNEHKIFGYELEDAWGVTIAKVDIMDEKKDNVRCWYPCVSSYVRGQKGSGKTITLNENVIKEIQNILQKHSNVFAIKEVEDPFVLDGYINTFYFSVAECTTQIEAFNISEYRNIKSQNAKIVLEIFDEIVNILLAEGVETYYLMLELGE